jgi:glycosyltransferase involved in cell wall biosynthesis
MREPLVSVIMCVRDGATYLREALDSIAGHGCDDLEVIVVDDGSTDDSVRIAAAHPLKPAIVSQPPLGINVALNRGLQAARGRVLSFLDCDDIWPDGRLAALLAALERMPHLDFVYGLTINTDEQLNDAGQPTPARLLGAMLIRREAARRVGAFRTDIAHAAIIDWHGRASALGLQHTMTGDLVLRRRIHGGNMGIRDRPRARTDLLRVVRDHVARKRR